MLILYKLFILLYRAAIGIAALWSDKAKAWVKGRKYWRRKLARKLRAQPATPGMPTVWMHCASLGEFEQGRPVLERLRKQKPDCKIVVSFFSPSGYKVRKGWDGADVVCYLPLDTAKNAKDFIEAVNPSLAIFVKYEFWYYHLARLRAKKIPAILISGAFRQQQPFFKWYGGLWRKMLRTYDAVFVQDEASANQIEGLAKKIIIAGDTRFDRVSAIAAASRTFPKIESFKGAGSVLIAASTWPEDETLLASGMHLLPEGWKLIIAPHEVDQAHLEKIERRFGKACVRYSRYGEGAVNKTVLIIDSVGQLSAMFLYGDIAYVGGGFNEGGIHNTLEPAAFGLPVIMGPVYEKFVEAKELAKQGIAFPVKDDAQYAQRLKPLLEAGVRAGISKKASDFMAQKSGATDTIFAWISPGL